MRKNSLSTLRYTGGIFVCWCCPASQRFAWCASVVKLQWKPDEFCACCAFSDVEKDAPIAGNNREETRSTT